MTFSESQMDGSHRQQIQPEGVAMVDPAYSFLHHSDTSIDVDPEEQRLRTLNKLGLLATESVLYLRKRPKLPPISSMLPFAFWVSSIETDSGLNRPLAYPALVS